MAGRQFIHCVLHGGLGAVEAHARSPVLFARPLLDKTAVIRAMIGFYPNTHVAYLHCLAARQNMDGYCPIPWHLLRN